MEETFTSFLKNRLINFIETSSKSNFSEVSIKGPDLKIIIKKFDVAPLHLSPAIINLPHNEDTIVPQEQSHIQIEEIISSWVGTFHQAKEAVNPGDKIETGKLLGNVKCMNLIFEIYSPVDGILLEVNVKQDEIVEYGQILFKINKG
jgi:acetyl-CoA carboxylase biotin carboxyl carrier protein